MNYEEFLSNKLHDGTDAGFDPVWMPDFLFPFQRFLVEWALRKGRAALFEDCGTGKTAQQLVWAENILRKECRPVLVVTPLAVSSQTIREGEKFGVECVRSKDGKLVAGITVTNYERLHLFDPSDYVAVVCDESSAIKNFDGKRRAVVTEFLRTIPYRLLCTATASPNDYIELGTSSEALGALGYIDMLGRFFKNDQNTVKPMTYRHKGQNFAAIGERAKWRFKHHAEVPFWRWVCSWARAMRKPSDLGFEDGDFILPELIERQHEVKVDRPRDGYLFDLPAVGLKEQREEGRRSIKERCERVAELVGGTGKQAVAWCHLNDESALLTKIIPGAEQVSGSDSDDEKEDKLIAFTEGKIRVLVTKPKIGAFGLNWQNCAHMTFFPSHSYEQYYQGIRRCWRFGQKHPVVVDVVTTPGEKAVMDNLQRKSAAADKMFSELLTHMNDAMAIKREDHYTSRPEVPSWA